MSLTEPDPSRDPWCAWLEHRRHGGDERRLDAVLRQLLPVRERVLQRAALAPGDILLDVGCGDGLIGLAALEQVGAPGRVVFSDICAHLLERCRRAAASRGMASRCTFVQAGAEDLAPIGDATVDAVTAHVPGARR